MSKQIEVGQRVRIKYPTAPDEWGIVRSIHKANRYSERRAVVEVDGKPQTWAIRFLEPLR